MRLGDHATTVTEYGKRTGRATVLIHSALLDHQVWADMAARLRGTRFITYDLRGHGTAQNAPTITGVGQLADDLEALLDALRLDRVDLVGVSLGGAVAQQFATTRADRVRSLTLIATAVRFPAEPLLARAESLRREGRTSVTNTTLHRWFLPDSVRGDLPHVRYARDLLGAVDEARWESVWQALAGFDASPGAATTPVPVLAIAGGHDNSIPPAVVRELAEAYPLGRFAEITDAPHLIPLERPAALGRILEGFLAEVGR